VFRYFIPFLLITELVFSTTWSGRILNDSSNYLDHAIVTHISSNVWVIADAEGYFQLAGHFSVGDTIKVQRYGYQPLLIPLPQSKFFTIRLTVEPINFAMITTAGGNESVKHSMHYYSMSASSYTPLTIRSIFVNLPGVTVRTYGGPGSTGFISVDGGSSKHTRVRFNGFDLSNSQTGMTDISQIPKPLLKKATYSPVGNTSAADIGGDGLVSIHPWGENGILFESGSYGYFASHAKSQLHWKQWIIRLAVGWEQNEGDFPVKWNTSLIKRKNNDFLQYYSMIQTDYLNSDQTSFSVFSLFSWQDRGNPGQIWSASNARKDDNLWLIGSSLNHLRSTDQFKIQWTIKSSRDHYVDDIYAIDDTHDLLSLSLLFAWKKEFSPRLKMTNSFSYSLDTLNSSRNRSPVQVATSLNNGFTYNLSDKTVLSIGSSISMIRQGNLFTDEKPYSLYGSYSYLIHKKTHTLFGVTGIETNRIPTLNEKFWSPGGNPDLIPEKLTGLSCYFSTEAFFKQKVSLEFYLKQGKNLIQWTPIATYWQPVNIKSTRRMGLKLHITYKMRNFLTGSLSSNMSNSSAHNIGYHSGKALLYAPSVILTNSFMFKLSDQIIVNGQSHYMSSIISRYDWPEDIVLSPILNHDIHISEESTLFGYNVITTGSIQNLSNNPYEMARGYPEMGRSYRLSFTIKLD